MYSILNLNYAILWKTKPKEKNVFNLKKFSKILVRKATKFKNCHS